MVAAAPPTRLFANFADAKAPVLVLAGADMRALVHEPQRLFALLRSSRNGAGHATPDVHGKTVRVVSRSQASAAVLTVGDTPENAARFSRLARAIAEDLLGEDPELPEDSFLARRPLLVWRMDWAHGAPQAYFQNRFAPDGSVLERGPAHRLARALWAIERRERAIRVLEAACASSSDALDHFHLGELLAMQLGRAADAVPHLKRASELAPEVSQSFTTLGLALVMTGDNAGAVVAFERACALAPEDAGAWANLAQARANVGDGPGMQQAAARAQQLEPAEPLTKALLAGGRYVPR